MEVGNKSQGLGVMEIWNAPMQYELQSACKFFVIEMS